jgi:hypothetical protein
MSDELDLTTDESLLSSISEHTLEELKLQPFSLLRQAVATDLCDLGGGNFFNAIITVWICTLNPAEVLKAHSDQIGAKIKAFEWAESCGYSLLNCDPLLKAYSRLTAEWASISGVRVKSEGNSEVDPNVGGQHE